MSMPDVGTDVEFERVNAFDKQFQFMRDTRPTPIPLDLKQLKDDGRA